MSAPTPAQLRAALDHAALVVAERGEAYLVIYERLEQEVAALDSKASALERARRLAVARRVA